MTIRSMTGFGSSTVSSQGWVVSVEARSVNHRGLDTRVWAPREWSWIEQFGLEQIRTHLNRGRVELRIDVTPDDESRAVGEFVDMTRFERIANELRTAATAAGISTPPTIADVLVLEQGRRGDETLGTPADVGPFEGVVTDALIALTASRAEEGRKLLDTLLAYLRDIDEAVTAIRGLAPEVAVEYQSRLEARLNEALERYGMEEIDQRTVVQEVAVYAERSDVSEELQRAASHVEKLDALLRSPSDEPKGKQIDFYLQELMREANTTGSKSGSTAITDLVIAMKSGIEKMREQTANVE